MASSVLYFPGAGTHDNGLLAERGCVNYLDHSPGSVAWSFSNVLAGGPDGGNGTLAWRDNTRLPENNPHPSVNGKQWRRDAGGKFYVGTETGRPPKPEELARGSMQPGEWMELADGQRWLIPTIRHSPRTIGLDDSGDVTLELKSGAKSLFNECGERLQQLVGQTGDKAEITFSEFFGTCVRVLATNYVLDANLAALLGLFDTHNLFRVLAVALDLDKLAEDAEKKTG